MHHFLTLGGDSYMNKYSIRRGAILHDKKSEGVNTGNIRDLYNITVFGDSIPKTAPWNKYRNDSQKRSRTMTFFRSVR